MQTTFFSNYNVTGPILNWNTLRIRTQPGLLFRNQGIWDCIQTVDTSKIWKQFLLENLILKIYFFVLSLKKVNYNKKMSVKKHLVYSGFLTNGLSKSNAPESVMVTSLVGLSRRSVFNFSIFLTRSWKTTTHKLVIVFLCRRLFQPIK